MGTARIEGSGDQDGTSVTDKPWELPPPFGEMFRIAARMAFRSLGDRDEAEDIAQEVVIAAHEKLEEDPHAFDDERSLVPWVFSVAGNKIVDRQRSCEASEQPFFDYEAWKQRQTAAEWNAEGQATADELEASIISVLLALPKARRETWLLVYYEGLSGEEAAKRRGVSIATHKNNLKPAQAAVQAVIDAHEQEGR
jgi:RNA polymerase sigma factor (sigma-70 family)